MHLWCIPAVDVDRFRMIIDTYDENCLFRRHRSQLRQRIRQSIRFPMAAGQLVGRITKDRAQSAQLAARQQIQPDPRQHIHADDRGPVGQLKLGQVFFQ